MTDLIQTLNAASVGLYGSLLAASFCSIRWDRKHKKIFLLGLTLMGSLQVILSAWLGAEHLRELYPLITHLPLALLLWYLSKQGVWSVISVFTAYLCCQLRRWSALMLVLLFHGTDMTRELIEILVTVPLLLLLFSFASPAVRSLSTFPLPMQIQFGILPAIGYVFDYLTRIYTDWLTVGAPAATEFMLFVSAIAQLLFARYSNAVVRRQREDEQNRVVLDLQLKQSEKQIAQMQKSQDLAMQYRHDLRHHLQYLSSCIENGTLEEAKTYINTLNENIINQSVTVYCENTAANLVLSSYAAQAAEAGIQMTVKLRLDENFHVSSNDLCVLLSNALENALHACIKQKKKGVSPSIEVRGYLKQSRFFLEIINSCTDHVTFSNGIPVTDQKGHGIGVKSICSIVEKYNGLYNFEVVDAHFVLRLSL